MRPRADEILHSVIATYEEYIVPEVDEPFAKSLAATIANLLRHVQLRIEHEGPILFTDNAEIRDVLSTVRAYCEEVAVLDDLGDDIAKTLDASTRDPGAYPTLHAVVDEATELRWALQRAIRALEERREALDGERYREIRTAIRRYLRASIEREAALIVPAFTGERR
jgi:hypothetical protein